MRHLLLSPLTWAMVLGALMAWRRLAAWRLVFTLGLLACAGLATPLGANALVWWLEDRLPALAPCGDAGGAGAAMIVVLAGGLDRPARGPDDFAALAPASLRRLAVALDVARAQPAAAVVFSGGVGAPLSEARLMATLAHRLGLAAGRTVLDEGSTTTWDTAAQLRQRLPAGAAPVQLVTSDLHAARAALALQRHGLAACRWRADSVYVACSGPGYLVPQSSALAKAERSLHELAGLLAYRLRRVGG